MNAEGPGPKIKNQNPKSKIQKNRKAKNPKKKSKKRRKKKCEGKKSVDGGRFRSVMIGVIIRGIVCVK